MSALLAIMNSGSAAAGALKVVIAGFGFRAGYGSTGVFLLTSTVTGATGALTYTWSVAGTSGGSWTSSGATATLTATVTGVLSGGGSAEATYTLTAHDAGSGATAASNPGFCTWINLSGGFLP